MLFATVEKVQAGFDAAGQKISEIDIRSQETAEYCKQLEGRLKRALQRARHAPDVDGGSRFGVFETEEEAKCFGDCILAALGKRTKAMGEIVDTTGGILVPDELQGRLIDLLPKYGVFRRNATVLPLGSASAILPILTSRHSVYSPGEGGTITPSDAAFSGVRMTPKTLAAIGAVSAELDEDSIISIAMLVADSMAQSLAYTEDLIGFLGDGTSAYFGMTGVIGALRAVSDTISEIKGLTVATGNAYSEITLGDFRKVAGSLPSEFENENVKWYVSKRFFHEVMFKLAEDAGVAGIYEILSNKKAHHFLGYPVEFTSVMPTAEANSQICALFGDLRRGAFIAQRKGFTLQRSEDRYFEKNMVALRGLERIDVSAIGCGSTSAAGPIVGLITAAA